MKYIFAFSAFLFSSLALAYSPVTFPWNCSLEDAYLIGEGFNETELSGVGQFTCIEAQSREIVILPVRLHFKGFGAEVGERVELFSFRITLDKYNDLFDTFSASAKGIPEDFAVGKGLKIPVRNSKLITMNLALMSKVGIESLNFMTGVFAVTVEAAGPAILQGQPQPLISIDN